MSIDALPIPMPDDYLKALGRVMVNWSSLEGKVDLVLIKLLGSDIRDQRAHIAFAQMTFQSKLDSLKALAEILGSEPNNNTAYAKFTKEIYPKLCDFQKQRNSIVHCKWVVHNNVVSKTSLTAKGKLKMSNIPVTLEEINKLADGILKLSGEVWGMVRFDEFIEVDPHRGTL